MASCETCKQSFQSHRFDARYCGNACRQRAYRERTRPLDMSAFAGVDPERLDIFLRACQPMPWSREDLVDIGRYLLLGPDDDLGEEGDPFEDLTYGQLTGRILDRLNEVGGVFTQADWLRLLR